MPRIITFIVEMPPAARTLLCKVLRQRRKGRDWDHGREDIREMLRKGVRPVAAIGEPRQVQAIEIRLGLRLGPGDLQNEVLDCVLHSSRTLRHPTQQSRRTLRRRNGKEKAGVLLLKRGGGNAVEDRPLPELGLQLAKLALPRQVHHHRQPRHADGLWRVQQGLEGIRRIAVLKRRERIPRHLRLHRRRDRRQTKRRTVRLASRRRRGRQNGEKQWQEPVIS